MSGDALGPTPEGQLIRQVRDLSIPRLSIRAAAKRIGLSAEQWGYVERGYRPAGAGQPPRPFSPPAATLAKMAHALRITPERLESEGQRPDAAEILREILHHEVEAADAARAAETLTVAKSNRIQSPPMTDPAGSRPTGPGSTRSTSGASPWPPAASPTRPAPRCSPTPPTTRRRGTASAPGSTSATGYGSSRTSSAARRSAAAGRHRVDSTQLVRR